MEDRLMDVTFPDFPMPAYDYLVYTAYETLPEPVKLGVMLVEQDGAVVVQAVVPGSVAADAEIREGDRVIAFDGQEIAAAFDLAYAVQQKKPGARGTLRLLRDGQELRLDVTFRAPGKPEKQHK
jgi:S1-C subfamily serine protease